MFRKKDQNKQNSVRSQSVFRRIQKPLILLAILNALTLLFVLYVMRVPHQLNQNSYDICQKQVDNRQRYLQSQMTDNWMRLYDLSDYINDTAERMLQDGTLTLETLDSSTAACTPLLQQVMDRMIQQLYSSQVSGIYLVFNTHDLEKDILANSLQDKTGVSIRDKDPMSVSSERYADLLFECSPSRIVQQFSLSTDRNWEQKFKFDEDHPYEDWLLKPYMTAVSSGTLDDDEYGLWSIKHTDESRMITYSVPLILSDGQVYGVLGIEILNSYLEVLLPHEELDEQGCYGLFISDEQDEAADITGSIYPVSEKQSPFSVMQETVFDRTIYDGWHFEEDGVSYEAALTPLSLYSRNSPFEKQKWYVIGTVPTANLYAFSNRVIMMLILSSVLILVFGALGAFFASWSISRPILGLQRELLEAKAETIPKLSETGITEVDDFATAITDLSERVVNSSKRFLSIMEMSSIEMGGYELDMQNDYLFVTDNYFKLFNRQDLYSDAMTPSEFLAATGEIKQHADTEQIAVDSMLYSIRDVDGTVRYIHVQERELDNRKVGVAEDVTIQVLERKHIERERDYDLLTGIFNRRAFVNEAKKILDKSDSIRTAVAIMIDLDNLKTINDTYGHEWGDRYIVAAAKCIQEYAVPRSVYARVSGDEFNILMYGFEDEMECREAIRKLWNGFSETMLQLPDGIVRSVSASGGCVMINNQNTRDISQLIKYADFAMYRIKKEQKGRYGMFDEHLYLANEVEKEKRNIFRKIVLKERIQYVFQPIVSAKTGEMFGCEALMRLMDSEKMNLSEFLRIARIEDAMEEVEYLTWFNALPAFQRLVQNGSISSHMKLFVNSQVNHMLGEEEQQELIRRFADIRDNVVAEVVETDDLIEEVSKLVSPEHELFAREYALDDYGTGYNSERNLISLMPRYIKIDMTLIRDVEKYRERQKLISGLVSFAHEKEMLVLAEGVETMAELHTLLILGADLFQGYLFAHPSQTPGVLNREAVEMVRTFKKNAV